MSTGLSAKQLSQNIKRLFKKRKLRPKKEIPFEKLLENMTHPTFMIHAIKAVDIYREGSTFNIVYVTENRDKGYIILFCRDDVEVHNFNKINSSI